MMQIMKLEQPVRWLQILFLFVFMSALCGFVSVISAQWTEKPKDALESKVNNANIIKAPEVYAPALEGPVDPEKYTIGPSDVLSVNIWTSPPINLSLTVTPEGTLIIPTVGEVRVVDLTLADAKKKIVAEIKKKFLMGDPTVTLINPRQVIISVTGAVRNPGKYKLNATDRIDKAVLMANEIQQVETRQYKETVIGKEIRKDEATIFEDRNQSKRNIRLTRRNGERLRIDISRYYAAKDDKLNPFLREGDEIFVPRIDSKKNVFGIYGGVNVQGNFELVEGDSFLSAIELTYGFTQRAMKDSIIHYRYNTQTGRHELTVYNFEQIMHDPQKNFDLIPGDRIVVKEQPDVREDYHVFVDGEVRYPGIYPILRDKTKLSEVVEWSGGFTEYAALNAAVVVHRALSPIEQQFDRMLSFRSNGIPEDTAYYSIESQLRNNHEAVNVNFKELFINKDKSQDIVLHDGDWINIPSVQKNIYVFGQVVSPGNVSFVQGEGYKYYISKAGGYTDNARSGDVMIIKRTTRQWLLPSDTEIEDGDNIWVPMERDRPFTYYLGIVGEIASVITAAVTIALLAIQLRK